MAWEKYVRNPESLMLSMGRGSAARYEWHQYTHTHTLALNTNPMCLCVSHKFTQRRLWINYLISIMRVCKSKWHIIHQSCYNRQAIKNYSHDAKSLFASFAVRRCAVSFRSHSLTHTHTHAHTEHLMKVVSNLLCYYRWFSIRFFNTSSAQVLPKMRGHIGMSVRAPNASTKYCIHRICQ